MAVEWTKDMILLGELARLVRKGGVPADERSALANRFGVSEELLLRYERAQAAWNAEIFDKRWPLARREAIRRIRALGKSPLDDDVDFGEEVGKDYERLTAEAGEDEISRERKDAANAIRIALGLPTDDT